MNANQAEGSSKTTDEGACSLSLSEEREDSGFFINKYTTDSSEMMVLMPGDGTDKDGGSDSVITVTDFKEIPGTGGYTTLVANIVSRPVTNAKSDSHKSEDGTKASGAGKGAGKVSALSRVKKNKCAEKVEKSGAGVSKENHLEKDRAGTDENEKARVEGQPSDASLSTCENPCKPKQVRAEESCPAASYKVSSPVLLETVQNAERGNEGGGKAEDSPATSLATGTNAKDVKADGCGYNRCFGNIFSKRGQGQQGLDGSEFKAKKQQEAVTVTAQKKKSAGWKSSTWEKTRRALSFTNEASKDGWEIREDKMSSLASYFCAAEKATGLPQLEGSKVNNESLSRPELDRNQSGHPRLNIKALEDLFLARSKIFSRKWYPDEEKKIKLQREVCQDRSGLKDAINVQSDASDHASSNTGDQKEKETPGEEMQGPVLTSKVRRRSMVEMGALSFSADGNEALGSGRSYSNISLDWETLPEPLGSQPRLECNTIISPSSVTSRL
ncbi:hypothetical protein PoB_005542300 [Plakobranchus ocellatus]|uniref:Uncharacterized protein n=1 Tax=Plakobranchus ocellatus TaxID=259542 RepID=A0AAV4CD74_9GAST|nr:hypothetical protein PoB_005542300 [Plakobranchus ocellatus]